MQNRALIEYRLSFIGHRVQYTGISLKKFIKSDKILHIKEKKTLLLYLKNVV